MVLFFGLIFPLLPSGNFSANALVSTYQEKMKELRKVLFAKDKWACRFFFLTLNAEAKRESVNTH